MKVAGVFLLGLVATCHGGNLMAEITRAGATTAFDLLHKTGLDKVLATGFYTLFVPTNEAFEQIPAELQAVISNNLTALAGILEYHATSHIFRSADAFNDLKLLSENGREIWINVYRESDTSPPVITAEGSRVIQADIVASNGYLHIVDRVLLPPVGDLYTLIAMSDQLSTLKALVDAAGLTSELQNGQGTLLAPTNDGFAALEAAIGKPALDQVVANQNMLREILLYHMTQAVVYSAGAFNGTYVTKDIGTKFLVETGGDGVTYINHARVLLGDVPATNGVMHVLDKVLVPPRYATSIVGK